MKRDLSFLFIGLILLAGLFLLFRPVAPPVSPAVPVSAPAPAAAEAAEPLAADVPAPVDASEAELTPADEAGPGRHLVELVVEKGGLVSGPAVIRVLQGDTLVLRITADVNDELHLHGYDKHLHLHAGETAELTLLADLAGRFEFELHKAHVDLGALEVHPR